MEGGEWLSQSVGRRCDKFLPHFLQFLQPTLVSVHCDQLEEGRRGGREEGRKE